jgi:hypothetical protein
MHGSDQLRSYRVRALEAGGRLHVLELPKRNTYPVVLTSIFSWRYPGVGRGRSCLDGALLACACPSTPPHTFNFHSPYIISPGYTSLE